MKQLKTSLLLCSLCVFLTSMGVYAQESDSLYQSYLDSANAFIEQDAYELAIEWYHKARRLDTTKTIPMSGLRRAHRELAFVHTMNGFYDKALKHQDSVVFYDEKVNGTIEFGYLNYSHRGDTKQKLGDYDGAMKDYNTAIKLSPSCKLVHVKRGELKLKLKDYNGAFDDFCIEIDRNPDYWIPYGNRASVYVHRKEYDLAIADLKKAIECLNEPNDDMYQYQIAAIKWMKEDYEGALNDYNAILDGKGFHSINVDIYCYRGACHSALGNFDQAMKDFDYVLSVYVSPRAHFERGKLWQKLGNLEKACADFQKAKEEEFEFDETKYLTPCE